ncbi:uncharacterized protein LOC111488464 [Cucurbita maxima]|uniref:Uncharacterized protein LOC111488464 n=1 Tax=Cucurbita maxima TaxID=3661 RepID=A0A6J1JNF1_CUCMA|nr:uncharacterized protein LOC111488464 [Cucurbita maxima]XP_022991977.1 uncharacterized protein LOC111488464 [Cucurbita maxima]
MDRVQSFQSRFESWVRDQRDKVLKVSWGPLQWKMRWPFWNSDYREQRKKIQQQYERRRQQLHDLCLALKAESVADLQEILCCMVLSECVYKRPASELVRAVNKFKADFGEQVVSLERVQPSSDHVPHRYLLAEAGDTLFASFIGTKQYKDVMADVNILQGAIFHEDVVDGVDGTDVLNSDEDENQKGKFESSWNPLESKTKQLKNKSKPAAHRGFLARANGIPALELYRLAQKKKQKLVLCGHSLGGAVAVLATLAILRGIAASSSLKESEKFQVKCITFSQPPVGNAALRDYVNRKGWQHHFKSYCIPEDLVPRLLSPAYFHHYNAQPLNVSPETRGNNLLTNKREEGTEKPKEKDGEQLVLGLGPVQTSFWRLSKLVPLESVRRQVNKYREKHKAPVGTFSASDSVSTGLLEDDVVEPQSLEIEEGLDGISLKPISDSDSCPPANVKSAKKNGVGRNWRKVPYLPSYVPFGQLYLLGNSTVESLSGAEYSKLTSVSSVIAELRERFQSHSMKSYRSRFLRIYELCMKDDASSIMGVEQMQQFPHLQQWLGLAVAGTVKLAQIVESPIIRTATSVVPLGWSGMPGQKNCDPLKVEITGFGLHLCTLVHAQVNGNWCSTRVESFPPVPIISSSQGAPELQTMRVVVGTPLKRPPNHKAVADSASPLFPVTNSSVDDSSSEHRLPFNMEKFIRPDGLGDFFIFCTSDFATIMKEVHVRTRRVRLLGLEGSGKTSLFKAIVNQDRMTPIPRIEHLLPAMGVEEAIAGGICYCDSPGVNLQELKMEASSFRDELWMGIRDLSRKTDLLVLVHNLSHKVPICVQSNGSQPKPALSLLLDEAKSLGIPWVLAITNKFSVSAHQQKAEIEAVLRAYQASPSTTGIINSSPYVFNPGAATASLSTSAIIGDSDVTMAAQKLFLAPINLVKRPFQRKETVLPVEGVNSLCQLIHRVLRSHEEASFQELSRERLFMELEYDRAMSMDATRDAKAKENSLTAAAVGASLGAGLGIVLAVVMGAASALRKP